MYKTLITELVVTEHCNLDCEYCYMKNTDTYMGEQQITDYIKNVHKIMEVYGCDKYHISYFGGEPLTNWGLVKKAIPIFNKDPRLESQVVISNGLLITQEIIDYLKEHNVGFSWSFDGMWQDENRPHKTITDTISVYHEKKSLLRQLGTGCKVMISPSNISTMTENLDFLVENFDMMNPDFSLVRDDIWSLEDIKSFKIESRRLADRIIEYNLNGEKIHTGLYSLALMDMIQGEVRGKRPFGCFAGCHGVGYFPDGSWYPCARFGAEKEYKLMGADGTLNMDNINLLNKPSITDPHTFKKCQECSLFKFCNAGCTYSQLKISDDGIQSSPVDSVCELYKIIYDDTLYIYDRLKDNKQYRSYLKYIQERLGV